MRRHLLLALLAVGLLFAAGCGGDDDTTATDDESSDTADESSDTADEGDEGDEGDEDAIDDLGDVADAFGDDCVGTAAQFASIYTAFGSAFTGADFDSEEYQQLLSDYVDKAPDELKDAFTTIHDELGPFFEALAEIDYQPGETPDADTMQALADASEEVDQEALDAASDEVNAYFEEHCPQ